MLVRAQGVPTTIEEEEAARPEGSYEKPAQEEQCRYVALILAPAKAPSGAELSWPRRARSEGDDDVLAERFLDYLPELARVKRGLRSVGR